MDMYAYSQEIVLSKVLEAVGVEIPRLRGLRLMKDETPIPEEAFAKTIMQLKQDEVEEMLYPNAWAYEGGLKKLDKRRHKCLKFAMVKIDEDDDEEEPYCSSVGFDWSRIHGKKRKQLKLRFKQIIKDLHADWDMFNQFVGTNTLYVHTRAGGDNRGWCHTEDLQAHPRWVGDVDDAFDGTYATFYFKLDGLDVDKLVAEGIELAKIEAEKENAEEVK